VNNTKQKRLRLHRLPFFFIRQFAAAGVAKTRVFIMSGVLTVWTRRCAAMLKCAGHMRGDKPVGMAIME
jgi:hypothetical protein